MKEPTKSPIAERNLGLIKIRVNPLSMSSLNKHGMLEIDISIQQARELRTQIIRAIRQKHVTPATRG